MTLFFRIIYGIALSLVALCNIPKALYVYFKHHKYRSNFMQRIGFDYPDFIKDAPKSIWIHAVSVGETKAVASLARQLKFQFPDHPLIISSITETGHEEAVRSLPFADYHVYLPFDFAWAVKRVIRAANPGLVILCETDFWFNFLYFSKQIGASLATVNGKISERSTKRLHWFSFYSKRIFQLFDVICVQNTLYRTRFIEANAPADKVVVTGNLKFDEDHPQLPVGEISVWRQKLGIGSDEIVLTIGSSHYSEEEFVLKALTHVWKNHPNLRVILVPRHPERFRAVAELLEEEHINWISFTNIARRSGKESVILMDAMGLLRMCYQLSDFAIVAGSFAEKIGGHNILEPCWYGKPVIFGPYMEGQLELVDLMKRSGAGVQLSHVDDQELSRLINQWINDKNERKERGEWGMALVKELKGSTRRTLAELEPLFGKLK